MALKDFGELNPMQMDVLREIGNIGTGNAATSLASMLCKPVNIQVPRISILEFDAVTNNLGGPENMIVGLLFALQGDVTGMMMFLLQKDFAHMVLNTLLGQTLHSFAEIDEMGISAMQEIGNIMAAAYVGAIAQLTDMFIDISVPDICIDMAGAILSVPAIHFANIGDKIIFIEDQFESAELSAASQILLIPEVESLNQIMTKLGIEI